MALEFNSMAAIISAAIAGLGVTLIPELPRVKERRGMFII